MRRILHVELDADYCDKYASAFFKSFYAYNKGWDLYVADLGLRDEQVKLLERYGVVEQYRKVNTSRWTHIPARLASLVRTVRNDDLIMHSDVDLIVLDNYEDLVEEFLRGHYYCMASHWRRPVSEFVRVQHEAARMLDVASDSPVFSEPRIHFGWRLLRGNPQMTAAVQWLSDNWEEFSTYIGEEESGLTGVLHARGLSFKSTDFVDCTMVGFPDGGLAPAWRPGSGANRPSRMVHFSVCKYYMDNAATGKAHENANAWRDVLMRPYAELPWPDPKDVHDA